MDELKPVLLEELETAVAGALAKRGITPDVAEAAAGEAVEYVRRFFGGSVLYVPRGLGYTLARRNAEILRRLDQGESRDDIRREFNLSDMQIRRIQAGDNPPRG